MTSTTSIGEAEETGADPAPSGLAGHLRRHQTAWLAAALAVPFVVAVVVLRDPHWYADQDFALNELRVRDVLAGDPPLIGMSGRLVHDGARGSHPGPLGFWLMAPVYWVFGRSSWALQVAAAALGLAAVGAAVALGARRAGEWGAVAATAGMAGLLFAYGPERWATRGTRSWPRCGGLSCCWRCGPCCAGTTRWWSWPSPPGRSARKPTSATSASSAG